MILADTSAWVELLRGTGSDADRGFRRLLREGTPLATTEVVVGEVLAGARDELEHVRLRRQLLAHPFLPLQGLDGFEAAARLVARCRAHGFTPSFTDCLVAVPAMAAGASILHADSDFDRIAAVTELTVYQLGDD